MSKELKPCPFCGGKAIIKAANKNMVLLFGANAKNVTQEPMDIALIQITKTKLLITLKVARSKL